jgi:hypothetical protein
MGKGTGGEMSKFGPSPYESKLFFKYESYNHTFQYEGKDSDPGFDEVQKLVGKFISDLTILIAKNSMKEK